MRKFVYVLLVLCSLSIGMGSCNKFDEGPSFSLRSKTKRLSQEWVIDIAEKNGLDITTQTHIRPKFKSDGTVVYKDTIAVVGGDSIVALEGLWEFNKEGVDLLMVFTHPEGGVTDAKVWHVLRLTSDEFWVNETVSGDLYRYQFVPK